ncbi:MAG: glycosyltransferase family 2 protein [Candidatus Omnitrophota bacterium]
MKYECDIILLSYESPELLKKCVESVLDNTAVPSRLIIIDNDSKDPEVKKYISEVCGRGKVEIEKVFSEENSGFAGGINKGLKLSTAPYVCILNNDCEVYKGWLKEMIEVASRNKKIGLVNPQSNTFGCCDYASVKDKSGKFVELGHAIGFACLIKKEVLDGIGMLDEAYEGVCYEDTDFSCRAQKAGFISVMAEGAYVYHKEQASRASLKGKNEIYRKNRELFESRWGKLARVLFIEKAGTDDRIIEGYNKLKDIARRRAIIDVWIEERSREDIEELLKEKGVIRHADIGFKLFTKKINALKIIGKILTKKKRYSALITPDISLFKILSLFSGLWETKVFLLRDDKYLISTRGAVEKIEDAVLS